MATPLKLPETSGKARGARPDQGASGDIRLGIDGRAFRAAAGNRKSNGGGPAALRGFFEVFWARQTKFDQNTKDWK